MAVLVVPAAATAFVGPDQKGPRRSLDRESFSVSGDGCALLPAALHRGAEGRLDQVTYLCGNELDLSTWQHARLGTGEEPGSKGTEKARILPGAVWRVGTPKRCFGLSQALLSKIRHES